MKKAIFLVVVSTVMIAAMTGIAVANPAEMDIDPNTIQITLDGSTKTIAEVTVTEIAYGTYGTHHGRYISVMTDNPNLYARVSSNGADTGWTSNVLQGSNWTADKRDYVFCLEVRGTEIGEITVYDNAGPDWNVFSGHDSAHASANTEIPEFATVAIPAAAVLGLVFFFNRRKRNQ